MKKNTTLILALLIPVLMLLLIIASIAIPKLLYKPQYNFLYAVGNGYCSYPEYLVKDNRLVQNQNKESKSFYNDESCTYKGRNIQLYIYDLTSDKSLPISLADAQQLTLSGADESPDAFTVKRKYGGGWMPFGSNNDFNAYYLLGHNISRKLELHKSNEEHFSSSTPFLGWIINEQHQ